jgi:3-O-methylgallate 3,4-dioxygenase
MAEIVLGIGTSHTPLLSLPAELWPAYAEGDRNNPELVYPPNGWTMSFEEALHYVAPEVKARYEGPEQFGQWAARCQRALDELSCTVRAAKPDVTVIVSDDQDEWFYESNMPALSVYWGETVPMIPRKLVPSRNAEVAQAIGHGYGDVAMDVPVASAFGRFLIEYLMDHDFDPGQMTYLNEEYSGRITRRYPKRDGEISATRDTPAHPQGLPHGFAFIIKRLFCNEPTPILPIIQNTCYPPNRVTPRRCLAVGQAIAAAIAEWPEPARVAVVASGGLSHFVVDEELDRTLLGALERKDPAALKSTPRHRLFSAASESMNWITLGGAVQDTPLKMELVDYVPVYRTPAATGGGWAFARWQ